MSAAKPEILLPIGEAVIRSLRATDAPDIAHYLNNRNIWLRVRDHLPFPYALSDAEAWLAKVAGAPVATHWAIANDEECFGSIGIQLLSDTYLGTAEIGYWVAEPYWGRGIATAAVAVATPFVIQQFGLRRVHAEVHANNPASCRVLERAGYEREGVRHRAIIKDGEVLDSYMYARLSG